jgi:ketosteroid isomerase-like protein
MGARLALALGFAAALAGREALRRALLAKFRSDLDALNRGDPEPLLSGYAEDAVLRFTEGEHRWAGEHRGREAIRAFLREFAAAGIRGEIRDLAISGPPWRLTMLVRFDDHAEAPGGERIYENRTVLVIRTRWGKVVEQEDFYEDTTRIPAFDRRLRELGIDPVAPGSTGD